MSLKKYPGKFYEEPLDGFFILCRERGGGCGYVACAFQEELNARFSKTSSSKTGPRWPYRKIKIIKNRGQNLSPIRFYLLAFFFIHCK